MKSRLKDQAYLVRYMDDVMLRIQYRRDAMRGQDLPSKRFGKFGLSLEPSKNKLIELCRFAETHAQAGKTTGDDLLIDVIKRTV